MQLIALSILKETNLNPNVYSYNTLMDAYIEKADYTEAINVFEVMQDNDVLPTPCNYLYHDEAQYQRT